MDFTDVVRARIKLVYIIHNMLLCVSVVCVCVLCEQPTDVNVNAYICIYICRWCRMQCDEFSHNEGLRMAGCTIAGLTSVLPSLYYSTHATLLQFLVR